MVGKIWNANRATFAQLNVTKKLNILGRFIHGGAEGMDKAFVRAKAKMAATGAVNDAIQRFERAGIYRSSDLGFLDAIIRQVYDDQQYQENLDDPHFRVALQDAAWKNSVGNAKLGILLKKRGGVVDGTRALKADLHKAAEANRETHWKSTGMAALLEAVKRCPTVKDTDVLENEPLRQIFNDTKTDFGFDDFELPADVEKGIPKALLSNAIGAWLTKERHPRSTVIDHASTLKLFEEYFDVFSFPEILSNKNFANSFDDEYYCFPLSIAVLKEFGKKTKFTKHDIALLKNLLNFGKFSTNPRAWNPAAAEDEKKILDGFDKIKLGAPSDDVLFQMSKVVAGHYLNGVTLDMSATNTVSAHMKLEAANNAGEVIQVLEVAFKDVLTFKNMNGDSFFQPLEDLAESWRPPMTA